MVTGIHLLAEAIRFLPPCEALSDGFELSHLLRIFFANE
jgi:hypothetical protein